MFYSLDKRPGIKAQNPEFGVGKLAQRLAENWRVMSPHERNPYESLARKDKQRYESELKSYKQGTFTGSSSICAAHVHSAMREMQQATDRSLEGERSKEAQGSSDSEKAVEFDADHSSQELDADDSPQEERGSEMSPSEDDEEEEGKGSESQERNELEQLCELYQ